MFIQDRYIISPHTFSLLTNFNVVFFHLSKRQNRFSELPFSNKVFINFNLLFSKKTKWYFSKTKWFLEKTILFLKNTILFFVKAVLIFIFKIGCSDVTQLNSCMYDVYSVTNVQCCIFQLSKSIVCFRYQATL